MAKQTFTIVRVGYRVLEIEAESLEDALDKAPDMDFGSERGYDYEEAE